MNHTRLTNLFTRLVNSTRLYLKRRPSYYTDDYPNAWCDVIEQEKGRFSNWSLYEEMIDGRIFTKLGKPLYAKHIKALWLLSEGADRYKSDSGNYEQDLFGPTPELIYPEDDWMLDDIVEMVKDELFYDTGDLDEEEAV